MSALLADLSPGLGFGLQTSFALTSEAYTARKKQGQQTQPDDLVKEVRSFGRSTVPDAVKAELLAELRDFIA